MILVRTVVALCLGATLCAAQTINIRGKVVDSAGGGIPGAVVKLEAAGIAATTGADGSFALTNGSTAMNSRTLNRASASSPVQVQNGRIVLTLRENTPVSMSIYDVGGRQIYQKRVTYGIGTHDVQLPEPTAGMQVYRVSVGTQTYSFKSTPFGKLSGQPTAVAGATSAFTQQAKSTAVISDIIAATKTGWLNYRCTIGNSDTSGVVIRMIPNAGDVTDVDGNVYQTVRIGNQVWMAQNLRVTKYSDGSAIPLVTDPVARRFLATPAHFFYNNTVNADSIEKFGALYNWYAVSPTNPKKIAPAGWHVPSDSDWTVLKEYLVLNGYNWDGTMETSAYNKIAKALAAKTEWLAHTAAGAIGNDVTKNNSTGFSALPGGYCGNDGEFYDIGLHGSWWSTTESGASTAWYHCLNYHDESLRELDKGKSTGRSVRLVRDSSGSATGPLLRTSTLTLGAQENAIGSSVDLDRQPPTAMTVSEARVQAHSVELVYAFSNTLSSPILMTPYYAANMSGFAAFSGWMNPQQTKFNKVPATVNFAAVTLDQLPNLYDEVAAGANANNGRVAIVVGDLYVVKTSEARYALIRIDAVSSSGIGTATISVGN